MLKKFINNIETLSLNKGNHILIAVSGGVDSVVLARLAVQYFSKVSIAHCNFQLRGQESDRDEIFVRKLAEELKTPLYFVKFDTELFAQQQHITIQEAARELRYQWFSEILQGKYQPVSGNQQHDSFPEFLFTAHHADDQIETFFIHLNRGSGLRGLKGMLPVNAKLIRPLLKFFKQDIIQLAHDNSWTFVEDSSNESDKYTRNYFRHHIIPAIEEKYPQFGKSLLRNISLLQGGFELYELKLKELMDGLIEKKNNEIHIPIRKLLKLPAYQTVLWELIEPYGFTSGQLADVESLFTAQTGKYVASESHQIFKHREWLILVSTQNIEQHHFVIDGEGNYNFPEGKLSVQLSNDIKTATNADTAQLDASAINFPLVLRKWREGDYFYPLGLGKKKKLARFCIDQKLSKSDKEKVWVLEMDRKIIWVIGLRVDDRFKLSPNTQNILYLQFKK